MLFRRPAIRRGASLVEFAVISPLLLVFVVGLVVGAFGVFRYQLLASLAREGARYASVRGDRHAASTGSDALTAQDVFDNAIKPSAVALDPARLSYSVTWDPDRRQGSYVVVRVTYQWIPEAFLGGITLSSTSRIPISF